MVLGKYGPHMQKYETTPLSYTKVNSKQINDLSLRPENFKLLEGNIMETLQDLGRDNDFQEKNPEVQAIKAKIDK